jgi:polyhydroxybutyrate depolymerase
MLAAALAGCGAIAPWPPVPEGPVGGIERPVDVFVPGGAAADSPMPLLILLHGFTASGDAVEATFAMRAVAAERGFLYAAPDGTLDGEGRRFWNASAACCNDDGFPIDDSAYLRRVVDDIAARWNVDERRVFVMGQSNGGFMSYRMACDHADLLAGAISIAGTMDVDPTHCHPSDTVHILHVHGTADRTIGYHGGAFMAPYTGAVETVSRWAAFDGCRAATEGPVLDLDTRRPGAETTVTRFVEGCRRGGSVELWTMVGSGHHIEPTDEFRREIADFIATHPKP